MKDMLKKIVQKSLCHKKMPAFTLAESLVVLVVITSFLLIPVLILRPAEEKVKVEIFLAQFEQNFLLLQQTAIAQQVGTTLEINREEQLLHFKISEHKSYPDLQIPTELSYKMPDSITISATTGNYSGMDTVTFEWENRNQRIEYVYQMGSGRFVKTIT